MDHKGLRSQGSNPPPASYQSPYTSLAPIREQPYVNAFGSDFGADRRSSRVVWALITLFFNRPEVQARGIAAARRKVQHASWRVGRIAIGCKIEFYQLPSSCRTVLRLLEAERRVHLRIMNLRAPPASEAAKNPGKEGGNPGIAATA